MNIVVTTPEPAFFDTIVPGIEKESGEFIAKQLTKQIDKIGSRKVVSICTDNASAMRKAWRFLEAKYSDDGLAAFGCIAHLLNLLMKDVGNLESVKPQIESAKAIVKKVKDSSVIAATFATIQKQNQELGRSTSLETLKNPGATRFGSIVTCCDSLLNNKYNLETLAIYPAIQEKLGSEIKDLIMDKDFWINLKLLRDLLKPVMDWTRKLESDKSKISQVAIAINQIKDHFLTHLTSEPRLPMTKEEIQKLKNCLKKREKMALRPVHFAANLLDPVIKRKDLTSEQ